MLTVELVNRHQKKDRSRFLKLAYSIYRLDPYWVPPLLIGEHIKLSNQDPFYVQADAQLFIAVRDGRDVGRIAAIHNQAHNDWHKDQVGFFGFFECEPDQEAALALFSAAEKWIKQQGLTTLRGPVNPSTNHPLGFIVSGEPGPPMVELPYNPPYYPGLVEAAGFKPAMDCIAHILDVITPQTITRLEKIARRTRSRGSITTRPVDMKHFDQEKILVREMYNSAWAQQWGFVPVTEAQFNQFAEDFKMLIDPSLVRFVFVNDQVAGFIVVLLNINEILIKIGGRLFPFGLLRLWLGRSRIKSLRLILMGVKADYRQRGLEAVLYYDCLQYAIAHGYKSCENSLLYEENRMVLRASEFMGGREYRRYRLWEKSLSA